MLRILFGLFLMVSPELRAGDSFTSYPADWWRPVPESERASWGEILPQEAAPGEVILSKRTELGVFSNLWATAFELDGVRYASIEGLWQMMKYPEGPEAVDPRAAAQDWPYRREQVPGLAMFEAKSAGTRANAILHRLAITWISYQGRRLQFRDGAAGSDEHYRIIRRATEAKLAQNPEIQILLKKTCGLKLRMDHDDPSAGRFPAYATARIYTDLREPLCR